MDTSTNPKPIVSNTETSSAPKPENPVAGFLMRWFLYRVFAALAWCWFILTMTGREIPFRLRIELYYLVIPFLAAWVGFVVAHKWSRALFYFPYLLFFPFLLLFTAGWWIVQFFLKTFKLPLHIFRAAKSGETVVLVFVGIIISWTVTVLSTVSTTRAIASLIALAGTYLLTFQSFRWASNPYRPMLAGIRFLSEKGRKVFEDVYVKPGMTNVGQVRDNAIKACDWSLNALDKLYEAKAPLSRGLTALTHRSLLPSFVFCFIFLYVILASSFSVSLFHIERAWGPQIDGIGIGTGDPPTLFSYFYFSFLSQATAVPDGIRPLSVYGQLWILWVVMTGILLLTILIALFTTSVGVHSDNAISEVRMFSDTARRDLTVWRRQLSQPVIEAEAIDVSAKVVTVPVEVKPVIEAEVIDVPAVVKEVTVEVNPAKE